MTEDILEVLDSEGNPTGATAPRSEIHRKGLWHAGAHVWVFNSKSEVLLQKRAMNKESYPGLLDVSAAGHMPAGETPDETAARELEEELGIKAKPGDLKKIFVRKLEAEPKPGFHNKEYDHVYLLKFDGGAKELKVQKDEVEEATFVPLYKFESDLKDAEKRKAYVPSKAYFFEVIEAIRKELNAEKF